MMTFGKYVILLILVDFVGYFKLVLSFNILDYTHYMDYLPVRQEGLAGFEDFRTSLSPPTHIRNRKMEIGTLKIDIEQLLVDPIWPTKWPYSYEDFRPWDYTRDEPINTLPQYQYFQSLLVSDQISIVPGLFSIPVKRHFILPKDKVALADHMSEYFFDGAKVLELFSCYESILPPGRKLGPTVGVGWMNEEMLCNPDLDDFIEQDITVDPFLPLADNYFDFVIIPCMFQLFQRPLDMFKEINRVLKPGGMAFVGVKLAYWSFLGWKQGRYYAETNYLEDVVAAGSFFHYAQGFTKPEAFDIAIPEVNVVGKIKDRLFPQPRLDFYAMVQARKRKDSPHGVNTTREPEGSVQIIEGAQYAPRVVVNPISGERNLGVKPEKKIPDSSLPCACGSGKTYGDCCQPLHDNKQDTSNLVQIVRGRFSALNYGFASYIIKTTHPSSKEYVSKDDDSRLSSKKSKFTIWEREVERFADAYEFKDLQFEDEARDSTPSSTTEDAFVSVKLDRKSKATYDKLYDQIEEKIRLRLDTVTNKWGVVSSEMKVKPAKQQMVKDTQAEQFKK